MLLLSLLQSKALIENADISWNPKYIILAWYKENCLIHSDFHIITFWVCCFFYKPQCNPRFHVCFDMGNSFTFHFWLSKCWVKVSFVHLPLWLKQCLWDHLGVEQFSWKTVIIGAWLALNWIDSRLVTAWLYGLWGNRMKEELQHAATDVMMAAS